MAAKRFEEIRKRAGVSRERAAVAAGVTSPTARLFEQAGPSAIKDPVKRESLARVYAAFEGAQPAAA